MRAALIALLTVIICAVPFGCGGSDRVAPEAPDVQDAAPREATTRAPDGLEIAYDVRGSGEVALVFVHCWSCHRGYWRDQVDAFAEDYRVVRLDLGGHGASATTRSAWKILDLAGDVVAVADDLQLERMILIGHSMGGPVSLEAARRMPGRVLGVVAVDTLHNADFEISPEIFDPLAGRLEADFPGTMEEFFAGMLPEGAEQDAHSWIVEQAKQANPQVGVQLMRDFATLDLPAMFRNAGVPIRAINAAPIEGAAPGEGPYPTNTEGNRVYADFDVVLIDGVGHFIQLENPADFNARLTEVLAELIGERPAA
ncbi:MAG: alpha/beta hydrolase [Acidobacteriota bacterium]|nr:alpha/beta hydrolase [Acidobacteriota bacterium]